MLDKILKTILEGTDEQRKQGDNGEHAIKEGTHFYEMHIYVALPPRTLPGLHNL